MMMENYFSRGYVLHAALASSLSAPSRYDFGVVRFCLEQPANNNEKMVKDIPQAARIFQTTYGAPEHYHII